MDSKRTYVYNVVLRENDVCPQGELLTDKELERMKQHNPRRDWPKVAKAKVYAESCYISFGVRFGRVKQYLNTSETIFKYGRIMENNKSQFKRTGVLHGGAECIEIQISHSGDAARYVSTIMFTVRDPEVTRGRWQEIRYSKRNGYAYIVKYGKRLYLYKFLRIY